VVTMNRIAVVGASLGGLRAVEALRREGFTGEISLIGEEPHFPPYDRPPMSKELLKGLWEDERARLKVADSFEAKLVLGRRAESVDLASGEVALDDGSRVGFDGLVVATGATCRMLPGGDEMAGVHVLRTYEHCVALRKALAEKPRVVVIGAGFIGAEVAATCRILGLDVTVVEFLAWPMERVLGTAMGKWAVELHEGHGAKMLMSTAVKGLVGTDKVEGVELADGTVLPADLVVVAIGVFPETRWLEGSGLTLDNGVVCDETLRAVGAENVVAIGDVCRWPNRAFDRLMRVEHWTNAIEQADHAAKTLLGGPELAQPFSSVPYVWSDQYDKKLQYVGIVGEFVGVLEGAVDEGRFVAAFGLDGILVGALCVNWPARMVRYKRAIAQHMTLEALSEALP
jgi:3-phenylpropionate/trans-cinnamate dioxygenase ferredoxin reductase component